jgi:hypothetical protein
VLRHVFATFDCTAALASSQLPDRTPVRIIACMVEKRSPRRIPRGWPTSVSAPGTEDWQETAVAFPVKFICSAGRECIPCHFRLILFPVSTSRPWSLLAIGVVPLSSRNGSRRWCDSLTGPGGCGQCSAGRRTRAGGPAIFSGESPADHRRVVPARRGEDDGLGLGSAVGVRSAGRGRRRR